MFYLLGSFILILVAVLAIGILIGRRLARCAPPSKCEVEQEANSGPVMVVAPRDDLTPGGLEILKRTDLPGGAGVMVQVDVDPNRPPATFSGKTFEEACANADEAIRARNAIRRSFDLDLG